MHAYLTHFYLIMETYEESRELISAPDELLPSIYAATTNKPFHIRLTGDLFPVIAVIWSQMSSSKQTPLKE